MQTIVESDIFDLDKDNVKDKLKNHFDRIVVEIKYHIIYGNLKNAKLVTRIKSLSFGEGYLITEIEEDLKKALGDE